MPPAVREAFPPDLPRDAGGEKDAGEFPAGTPEPLYRRPPNKVAEGRSGFWGLRGQGQGLLVLPPGSSGRPQGAGIRQRPSIPILTSPFGKLRNTLRRLDFNRRRWGFNRRRLDVNPRGFDVNPRGFDVNLRGLDFNL
jgi:hypothetical protein